MFAVLCYAVSFVQRHWPKFCKIDGICQQREKKGVQKCVQKDMRDKREKEYGQRILLYVGGGHSHVNEGEFEDLEPVLVSIKINEQTSVDSHVRRIVCIFWEAIEFCHCAASASHQATFVKNIVSTRNEGVRRKREIENQKTENNCFIPQRQENYLNCVLK